MFFVGLSYESVPMFIFYSEKNAVIEQRNIFSIGHEHVIQQIIYCYHLFFCYSSFTNLLVLVGDEENSNLTHLKGMRLEKYDVTRYNQGY